MTALCGGGTSAPKIGTDLVAAFSTARLTQLAVLRGLSWTSPWLALISLLPIGMTAFCGSDPPTISTLTTDEVDALVNLTIGADLTSALGKIKDMLLNAIWQDLCECTSGSFTPPTYPAPVTGTPIPQLPRTDSATCQTYDVTTTHASGADTLVQLPSLLGMSPTYTELTVTVSGMTGGASTSTVSLEAIDTQGNFTFAFNTVHHVIGDNGVQKITIGYAPTTVEHIRVRIGLAGSSTTATFVIHADIFCGANRPGGVTQPCCPPDEATANLLEVILRTVTLIQRQNAPFAYVAGTSHSGISSAGSIAIQGLIGAKVDVTTLPSSYGSAGSSPTELFDLGFLTFGTPDGWPSSYRLDHDPMLMFPRGAGLYTTLDYDLGPGVVVTITELLREP